jgi:hypothetical protein
MAQQTPTADLADWIARVQKCKAARDVFALLQEFRKLPWSDNDRARMSKAYVKVLERVGAPAADDCAAEIVEEKNDGPVWYEKM